MTDIGKAKAFYEGLFGREIQQGPPEPGGYAMCELTACRQLVDGNTLSSIVDLDGNAGRGQITAAQMLEVADRVIARGKQIYDTEALRRVMAQSGA